MIPGCQSCFNSYVVRLKEELQEYAMTFFVKFQFLCGAIKSCLQKHSLNNSLMSFNSYVVRLKASNSSSIWRLNLGFNSYVVRLKECNGVSLTSHPPLFQFLCGAIKSFALHVPIRHHIKGFNSYVVRLKAFFFFRFLLHLGGFNSYVVRLKVLK